MARNNSGLHKAKKDQKSEFYTQIEDIEYELSHYDKKIFEGKVVYCNCDDPFESNFFKYFALRFNSLKLKKLICTCYDPSPVAGSQLSLFEDAKKSKKKSYKVEIEHIDDVTGNGAVDIDDIRKILKTDKKVCRPLEGNGDFRSTECIELLKQADIVVTNPPFHLFRDYITQLVQYKKQFLVIGEVNAITYKEIFPLIRDNNLWVGHKFNGKPMLFRVPDDYPITGTVVKKDKDGNTLIGKGGTCWFTNINHSKRHENLLLCQTYTPNKYPKYDNYDAIEVGKVANIPCDYEEGYWVPLKYKQKLKDAGFALGTDRLNSKGEMSAFVPLSLSLEASAQNANQVLQRSDGRSYNLSQQIQPETISNNGHQSSFLYGSKTGQSKTETTNAQKYRQKRSIREIVDKEDEIEYCSGVMGVPITFLGKYNPDQFEIVAFRKGDDGKDLVFTREREREFNRIFASLCDSKVGTNYWCETDYLQRWKEQICANSNTAEDVRFFAEHICKHPELIERALSERERERERERGDVLPHQHGGGAQAVHRWERAVQKDACNAPIEIFFKSANALTCVIKNAEGKIDGQPTYARLLIRKR